MAFSPMSLRTSSLPASSGSQSRQASTPRSSPPPQNSSAMTDKTDQENGEPEDLQVIVDDEDADDGMEGMDGKANALTNLLKTSSVFVAIMADKMKDQQRQQREQAQRDAAKQRALKEKAEAPKSEPRRSTRAHESDKENYPSEASGNQDAKSESKSMVARGRSQKSSKAATKGNGISQYFDKRDMPLQEDGPTVQEALAQAADEYEAKPEGLGAQELVATQQPALMTGGKMREYQLEGLEWLKTLWMNGLCGILADEMGLGKTIQAISMIAFFKEKNISGPFLIAGPLSTVNNWIDEFAHWTPSIPTVLYHGSKDGRAEIRRKRMKMQDQKKPNFPVIVTSYEICMNDRKFLANYQWRYIIVDEGHRLKNMNCRLIKELLSYNSANRLLITGTPLQNNIAELWSLLHFLLPEVFNDLTSFQSWFDFSTVLDDKASDGKGEKRRRNLVSTIHAILKPFLLRRVKSDVESSLPKKREYVVYAPLTHEQKELYREILSGTSRDYLEGKAVERIEAKSRTASLKRKAPDSRHSTPAKSIKSARSSTPASTTSVAGSGRRGRKGRMSYKDISDREFDTKLRRLEKGEDEMSDDDRRGGPAEVSSGEEQEMMRTSNLKQAKREISGKKLQNPVMQARLACNSPHNFYWPWEQSNTADAKVVEVDDQVDSSLITASGKLLLLDQLLPRLFSQDHKVLIFSQFKTTLDILETYARALRNWPVCRIDGSISQSSRSEQIKAFNQRLDKGGKKKDDVRLFLLSTRAGGQGINLVAADTVILFDSDWNPQQDLQAMDRAHRIGQTRPVIVYRLATRGTVEEALLAKADTKRRLEKVVIQKGRFKSLLDQQAGNGQHDNEENELHNILTGGGRGGGDGSNLDNDIISSSSPRPDHNSPPATTTTRATTNTATNKNNKHPQILSEVDLLELTDRSDAAYERAEKIISDSHDQPNCGFDVEKAGSRVFRLAETSASAGDV